MDQSDDVKEPDEAGYAVRIAAGINAFTREEWDGFVGTTRTSPNGYNPFISFD